MGAILAHYWQEEVLGKKLLPHALPCELSRADLKIAELKQPSRIDVGRRFASAASTYSAGALWVHSFEASRPKPDNIIPLQCPKLGAVPDYVGSKANEYQRVSGSRPDRFESCSRHQYSPMINTIMGFSFVQRENQFPASARSSEGSAHAEC